MKKNLFFSLIVAFASTNVFAGCVGSVVGGNCAGVYIDNPSIGSNQNENDSYRGSSGARYQYDRSDMSDRLNYSVDLDAQRRDRMNVNPGVTLDRGIGQYGGGVYDD